MKSRHLAVLSATALGLSGCGFSVGVAEYRHRMTADAHVDGPVNAVDVSADTGRVNIRAGSGTGVRVHRVVRYRGDRPHPSQRLSGGLLTVTDGCSHCSVAYDLTVPATARVKVRNDSGRIEIEGVASVDAENSAGTIAVKRVRGAVRAHADSGSLDLEAIDGNVAAHTSSGEIRAFSLRSPRLSATTDVGSVRLRFEKAPNDVRARTSSGSLVVEVPGGPYRIDADPDDGRPQINVPQDPAASARLSLRTEAGHISVDPA